MIVSEIKLYELLKSKLGEKEAEAFIGVLDARVDNKFEERKNDFILQTDKDKLLTKEDAIMIFATKADLADVKAELIKWMFIFWSANIIAIIGGLWAIIKLYLSK